MYIIIFKSSVVQKGQSRYSLSIVVLLLCFVAKSHRNHCRTSTKKFVIGQQCKFCEMRNSSLCQFPFKWLDFTCKISHCNGNCDHTFTYALFLTSLWHRGTYVGQTHKHPWRHLCSLPCRRGEALVLAKSQWVLLGFELIYNTWKIENLLLASLNYISAMLIYYMSCMSFILAFVFIPL